MCVYECACALRISHANLVNDIRKHSRIKGFASGLFSAQNAEAIVSTIFLVDFKCLSSQQLCSLPPLFLSGPPAARVRIFDFNTKLFTIKVTA